MSKSSSVDGVASALGDNVAALNHESSNMETKKSAKPIREGGMQPTSKMSIEDLLKMETQCADFQVSSSSEIGTVIYQSVVNPINLTSNVTTRVEWLCRLFRFWCGVIHFKFIFTKTILQQTKFLAVFVPGAKPTDPPPTTADAYFYAHKMVMNPANETEVCMSIPFVSDRPYLELSNSTGMFYFMVYQPIVASFDTSTTPADIFVKVFVSGDIELHETVPLINLNGEVSNVIPSTILWAVATHTDIVAVVGSNAGTTNLITTAGNLAPVAYRSVPAFPHLALTKGKPYLISDPLNATISYNPATCRALTGMPSGNGLPRTIYIPATDITSGAAGKYVALSVCSNATGVWLYSTAYPGDVYEIHDGIYDLAGVYTSCFSDLSMLSETMSLSLALQSLGLDINDLIEARNLRACGNDHDLECDCGTCNEGTDFSVYGDRLLSFFGHEEEFPQDPRDFADSGCYYFTHGTVRCCDCNVTMSSWLREDNVDSEHFRLSPRCCRMMQKFNSYDECGPYRDPMVIRNYVAGSQHIMKGVDETNIHFVGLKMMNSCMSYDAREFAFRVMKRLFLFSVSYDHSTRTVSAVVQCCQHGVYVFYNSIRVCRHNDVALACLWDAYNYYKTQTGSKAMRRCSCALALECPL